MTDYFQKATVMIKVLTKDIYKNADKDGHRGGPTLFIEKLIKACARQGIAEFTFDPADHFEAVLDGTIDLRRTFTIQEVQEFGKAGKPFVLRLSGLGHKRYQTQYVKDNCEIIRASSHVIYQSNYCRDAWLKSCPSSMSEQTPNTIIMNGDDPGRFAVDPMHPLLPGVTFAAVASWGPVKRIDFIIDLFKSLIRQGVDVSLLIGGRFKNGVACPPIEDEFKDRMVFCGYVEPWDIPGFYKSADAFIHARAGDWCPNAVVEALCAGLPGVVNSLGGTSELLGEAGVEFDEHDIGKASRAVVELIENYQQYKNKVAERTQILDIDFVARRYVDVLKQPVSRRLAR